MLLNKNALDLIRARECLTLDELTKRANVSKATICQGYKKDIGVIPIGKLARALDVDVEEIIIMED